MAPGEEMGPWFPGIVAGPAWLAGELAEGPLCIAAGEFAEGPL